MTTSKDKLMEKLLDLNEQDRAELAGLLIESLDGQVEEGVEVSWVAEIERRMESLDTGEAQTVSWEKVKEQLCLP